MNILVTGATGYVGGRLIPLLLDKGYNVRVLVRNKERLKSNVWYDRVEVFEGDVLKKNTIKDIFDNINTAFYLVHSMGNYKNFESKDISAAKIFSTLAHKKEVKKIIYLGGLANQNSKLSKHLKSRIDTGKELRKSGINIIEFQAGVIVGSGSLSFEMIRNLSERIPVMICPKWVYTKTQPIAIKNILEYLIEAIKLKVNKNYIFEIGGKDILSYGNMIKEYSNVRKLNRFLIPVPVLTPKLSSYWVHWTTPLSSSIIKPLVEGLKNESIVKNNNSKLSFPDIKLLSYKESVTMALDNLKMENVATSWSDSLSSTSHINKEVLLKSSEGMIIERRVVNIKESPENIFSFLLTLGGEKGWLYANILWIIRGYIDLVFGGVGLRRGRKNQAMLKQGDALDFWRVEKIKLNKLLRLKAEMKLPGDAWLEYKINNVSNINELVQTAYFAPKGLFGLLYWYSLYPIHKIIFRGLINKIKYQVEK